jgi:glycosyltransferase involved in cell wall biosynthesis
MQTKVGMISIVIPALNEEQFLPECLESLNGQEYCGDYEITVVDNSSTDDTSKVAREFGAKVFRVDLKWRGCYVNP